MPTQPGERTQMPRERFFQTSTVALTVLALLQPAMAHHPHDVTNFVRVSPNYHEDGTLFVPIEGTFDLLLRSTDRGDTWHAAHEGMRGREPNDLAFSPDFANDQMVYVATDRGGLDVSTDGGDHWFGTCITGTYVMTIGISPDFKSDDLLLVGTRKGLYRSTDRGATKEVVLPHPEWPIIEAFEFSPDFANDGTVYAAADSAGLLRSMDWGESWEPVELGFDGTTVRDVAVAPDGSSRMILATWGRGLLFSLDRGATWTRSTGSSVPLDPYVTSVAMSPNYAQDHRAFATTKRGGLMMSEDHGRTWESVNMGFIPITPQTDKHWRGIEFSPTYAQDEQIFVNMFEGLRIYRPGYVNPWFSPRLLPTRMGRRVIISPQFAEDNSIIATGYGVELYYSEDRGQTWEIRNQGSGSVSNYSLAVSPTFGTDNTLLSGTGAGVEYSTDRGKSWSIVIFPGVVGSPASNAQIDAARAMHFSPDYAIDSTAFSGDLWTIRKTIDGGKSWTPVFDLRKRCHQITMSPNFSEDQMVMFVTASQLMRSDDAGESWYNFGENLPPTGLRYLEMSPEFPADSVIFAGYLSDGLSRSMDGGHTWESMNGRLPDLLLNDISISGTFPQDHTIAAATHATGVIISSDRGQSWERRWPDGLEGGYVECLSMSPDYAIDSTIVAGSLRGYYVTTNGGRTWQHATDRDRYDDARSDTAMFFPGGVPLRLTGNSHIRTVHKRKKPSWVTIVNSEYAESSMTVGVTNGASMLFPFEGTGVRWIGARGPTMGMALWSVDGAVPDTIDLWAPETENSVLIHSESDLPRGLHHANIEVLGGPSGEEGWNFGVSVDAFDVEYDLMASEPDGVNHDATTFRNRVRR